MDSNTVTEMETIITSLVQMGALGIMLAYMMFKESKTLKTHQDERKEWHEASQHRNDEISGVIEKNTAAFTDHQQTLAILSEKIDQQKCKA